MHIRHLKVTEFRNLAEVEIFPDPSFNILWGNNAQGKTNLIEALYLLGHMKSFRGARNEELLRHGSKIGRIQAGLDCGGVRRCLDLGIEPQSKKGRVDGKEARSAGSFLGHLRPVLFSPEEVGLIKGPPAGRRDLIDRAIFQADPTFLARAQEYRRILRQRNCLLRENSSERELLPWSEALVRIGARIRQDRSLYLGRLASLVQDAYSSISGGEEAALVYPSADESVAEREKSLQQELEKSREREKKLGQTLVGPHRDSPRLLVNGLPLRLYGSQGQQRSFILAFKAAQIMDLEQRTGESPVLLLDDMTSELDRRRQGFFFRFLHARKGQVFITTTDIRPLIDEGFRQSRFYRVSGGKIEENCRQ